MGISSSSALTLVNVINCFKIFIIERRKSGKQIEDEVETRGDQVLVERQQTLVKIKFGYKGNAMSCAPCFTVQGKMAQKRGENDTNAI